MKLPDIDLVELEKSIEQNRKDRRQFISDYVKWLKKTDNKTWSSQQKKIID